MEKDANILKRITAYLLDIVLIYTFMILITNIRFINPTYDKLVSTSNEYTEVMENYADGKITEEEMLDLNKEYTYKITKYSISTNIVVIVTIFAYFGLFQKFNKGQTLGKKIMKIKVTGIDNKEISLGKYLLRILPTYYVYIGSIIPLTINSVLVFVLNSSSFSIVNTIIIYSFFILNIVSLVIMNIRKDKRGIHDLISGTKVVFE